MEENTDINKTTIDQNIHESNNVDEFVQEKLPADENVVCFIPNSIVEEIEVTGEKIVDSSSNILRKIALLDVERAQLVASCPELAKLDVNSIKNASAAGETILIRALREFMDDKNQYLENKRIVNKNETTDNINKFIEKDNRLLEEKNKLLEEKMAGNIERNKLIEERNKFLKEVNKSIEKSIMEKNSIMVVKTKLIDDMNKIIEEKLVLIEHQNKSYEVEKKKVDATFAKIDYIKCLIENMTNLKLDLET